MQSALHRIELPSLPPGAIGSNTLGGELPDGPVPPAPPPAAAPASARGLPATASHRDAGFWAPAYSVQPDSVALFQDQDPWGQTANQTLLTAHGIPFTVFGSASLGAVDLSPYAKVVIASQQPYAFYAALSAARGWLDQYVRGGGTLEFHGASFFADDWSALPMAAGLRIAPQGGTAGDDALTVVDPASVLANTPNLVDSSFIDGWNYSTHSYFLGADAPFDPIITEDEFGLPVLIDFRYGRGRVLATMMTVEWGGGDLRVLENLLLNSGAGPVRRVALLQDQLPWSNTVHQDLLNLYGIPYTIVPSTLFGAFDLTPYDKVVVASCQPPAFYAALSTQRAWLDSWVRAGGTLEFHGASYYADDWSALPMPAGLTIAPQDGTASSNALTIADPTQALATWPQRLDDALLDNWSSSAHSYFTGAAQPFTTVVREDAGGMPVLIDFPWDAGRVIATMMTVEWWYADARVLENLLLNGGGRFVDEPRNVALFQDRLPWGMSSNADLLALHAIPYTVFGLADLGAVDLGTFDKVVVASDQSIAFYQALSAQRAWLDQFVQAGGTLELHGAVYDIDGDDWWQLPMPAGLQIADQTYASADDALTVVDPTNVLTQVPNRIGSNLVDGWGYSAHSYFTGAATSFDAVVEEDEFGQPVLIDFAWGRGRVIATMMTVEWWGGDLRILENLLLSNNAAPATWRNYGAGWPGTLGVPSLTATRDPALGMTASIQIGNSAGVKVLGLLVLGFAPASIPTSKDGTLLVLPYDWMVVSVKAAGSTLTGALPFDPALSGVPLYLQVLENDPGASRKMSFTPGLELVLGL